MSETVEAAKAEFLRAKGRVLMALNSTPDDKLNWSPSATARTPVEVAAHCAMSVEGMQNWLAGKPFPFSDMKELDDYSRAQEKEFTKEKAVALLEENSNGFIAFLDGLTDEQVASQFETMMGSFPMSSAITFSADHLRSHAAQMDYIQTIYGDREMHMG